LNGLNCLTGSRHRLATQLTLGILATLGALPAFASEPLYVKNLSPVAGLLGLPSQRDAHTTEAGSLGAALHSSIANHYVNDASRDEFLNLDGETLRFALELRYGLAENWDVQLEVPWLDHSGGDLDGLIDDWHDLWGMSDGGRSDVPRDMLDYRYATPAGAFGMQDSASGLGDVSLSTTYAFHRDDSAVASLVLGYKFGSGDDEDFTGSGADDAFIAIRFSGDQLSDLPLCWHGPRGYLRAGDSDMMEEFQEQNLWFAGLTMDWQFAQRWSLIAQLDSHAAPLDSDITGAGDDAIMATLGTRWQFAQQWSVDISVVEDIRVETAPDVTFQASLRYRPVPN
jgi:hypothetical protein